MSRTEPPPSWWSTEDLYYRLTGIPDTVSQTVDIQGREDKNHTEVAESLYFGNCKLEDIARQGTPVYVLRPARAGENLEKLKKAAPEISVYYAIKANRHPLVLDRLRHSGLDGVDVCSPNEAKLALSGGIPASRISYTGTSVSNADLDFLLSEPDIHVNVDSLCALYRLLTHPILKGKKRRREIGIRINPEMGLGYRQEKRLTYSGLNEMSKFGILYEQIPEALAIAQSAGVAITTLHWHVGCGWLAEQMSEARNVIRRGLEFAEAFPDLNRVNLGGGLGVPLASDDIPLDLVAWNAMIHELVAGRWQVMIEPGAFLVQNSTALLVEVCTVEPKRGEWFIGINSGFNLLVEPIFYGMPSEVVPLHPYDKNALRVPCRFAGNINEAHDVLPLRYEIPLPREGDFFALLNAGAYGTSMASWHCLRGGAREVIVD